MPISILNKISGLETKSQNRVGSAFRSGKKGKGAMTDLTQNELVSEIARDVVTQIASQELPIFQAVSEAYFANPGNALKGLKSEDRVLGFGLDPTAALLTPVVLRVLTEVFQFLLPIAKQAVEDGLGSEISVIIKRM